jgi:hypothetical protein
MLTSTKVKDTEICIPDTSLTIDGILPFSILSPLVDSLVGPGDMYDRP